VIRSEGQAPPPPRLVSLSDLESACGQVKGDRLAPLARARKVVQAWALAIYVVFEKACEVDGLRVVVVARCCSLMVAGGRWWSLVVVGGAAVRVWRQGSYRLATAVPWGVEVF
jgi:hypothetical protein